MADKRLKLSDSFWLSLSSTFGVRRAVRDKAAAVFKIKPPPVAALFPEDPSEVSIVIETARREGVPLAVCGACSRSAKRLAARLPGSGYVALGTERMSGVDEVRPESLWMKVQAGTSLQEAMRVARRHQCRLAGAKEDDPGTVGGWLSSRAGINDWILGVGQPAVLSLEAVLPTGNLVHSVAAPRAATGPDLFSLFLGTWGGFGVITRATVKLEPLPEHRVQAGFNIPSTAKAVEVLRDAVTHTFLPRRAMVIVERRDSWRKARLLLEHEGQRKITQTAVKLARRLIEQAGGREEEGAPGDWPEGPGETGLKTGVRWSRLMDLLRLVDQKFPDHQRAIIDRPCLTGCRLRLDIPAGKESAGTLGQVLDPDGDSRAALVSARGWMSRVRDKLDPQGLLNPQAWPLPWPGDVS